MTVKFLSRERAVRKCERGWEWSSAAVEYIEYNFLLKARVSRSEASEVVCC